MSWIKNIFKRDIKEEGIEQKIELEQQTDKQVEIVETVEVEEEYFDEEIAKSTLKIENGVVVASLVEGQDPPAITGNILVKMIVNDKEETGTYYVQEGDVIELLPIQDTKKSSVLKLTIDRKKMKVDLYVSPAYATLRKIKDTAPASNIEIKVTETKVKKDDLTIDDVYKELSDMGIVTEVDESKIVEAIQSNKDITLVVTEGVPVVEGENGSVHWFVEMEGRSVPVIREDGTVDFREVYLPTVEAGEKLAEPMPAKPGIPGMMVTGEVIEPKPVFEVVLRNGKGVTIDEGVLISTTSGRPIQEEKGQIITVEVVSALFHKGDVNIRTGNLRFKGDIEVEGGLEPGMTIDAMGSILLKGTSIQATLSAGQDITITKNAIKSSIIAGGLLLALMKNKQLIIDADDKILQFIFAVRQVLSKMKSNSASVEILDGDVQKIMSILSKTQFSTIGDSLRNVHQHIISQPSVDDEWTSVIEEGVRMFNTDFLISRVSFQEVEFFSELFHNLREKVDIAPVKAPHVMMPYCLNCDITSAGDVTFTKQGCHNTNIVAYGDVRIGGVMRGGEIRAFGDVYVKSLEARGTPTRVIVPASKSIKAGKVEEEVIIQIGVRSHKFLDGRSSLHARIDADGKLLLD